MPALGAPRIVQTVPSGSRAVTGEPGPRDLMPGPRHVTDPHIAVLAAPSQPSLGGVEILQERMEALEMSVGLRTAEPGDKAPIRLSNLAEPRRINRAPLPVRLHRGQETVGHASPPRMDEIALSAGAFIAELPDVNAFAFRQEFHPGFRRNVFGIVGFEGTPDGEENAALRRAVDLDRSGSTLPATDRSPT